ncbi:response regulator [Geomesophilobacter sediminis]|uniref:Response regulator n=1 Tax=Geomesophilobacter sediminis TaxID=2798584 RepID=A0A8J7LXL5_9BACT|nr:response regulator [Geomesophilobacter sediminis]MBJ6723367.1 response regulator [Geomesophilobacter sediminis]
MKELSILLVEDNPDDEWLALRTLRKMGAERITVARDGFAALSELGVTPGPEPHASLPDLVLLDLKLPKMDGIEVLWRLRSCPATAGLNVVVLSSSEDPQAHALCRGFGVLACLSKPLLREELLPIIKKARLIREPSGEAAAA